MKQSTANLAEDYCFIHKALRPVSKARRQNLPRRGAAVKFEACNCLEQTTAASGCMSSSSNWKRRYLSESDRQAFVDFKSTLSGFL